ncbi:hypothetical protein K493DRAFT_337058 [Basidiobolus meristosporus CBS 931.73]|uniref:SURP motif domain-containing protein n=1 Tax=Basidiobolus meristosporus CBS 931.73 TaxID=1314790 RepID=A0A1Y1YET0_9FUNG|nr:hypothetical protein K493DRAFT_337058 [Basidiobolus meristosporus CBS 931.73]|eukprot:ORX96094.1 hypothetical protein K493DRAFT_337058 [Basidiobolus meristosporus CBS 931.73]
MFFSETLLPEPKCSEERGPLRRRRRNPVKPKQEEFLVFGYTAKIVHDEATALDIESGNRLIQWRNDTKKNLLLDRYDVRNLLDEYERFENTSKSSAQTSPGSLTKEKEWNARRYQDLDSEEEALYDMSEDERNTYIEEKKKRRKMQAAQKEYAYVYDGPKPQQQVKPVDFKFQVPDGMILPSDKRQVEIIERTAKFLNTKEPKMEIIIQAKQSHNPDFCFLNKDDPLHAFYRHVRWLVQTGLYDYSNEEESEEETPAIPVKHSTTPKIPPPEMRNIIDKMADFVTRNGPSLEEKVKANRRNDPKFGFLLPRHEYHAYYQEKIRDLGGNASRKHGIDTASLVPPPSRKKRESSAEINAEEMLDQVEIKALSGEEEDHGFYIEQDNDQLKMDRLRKARMMLARLKHKNITPNE